MTKGNVTGHKTMLGRHAGEVNWKMGNLVSDSSCFGVGDKVLLFKDSKKEVFASLIYDGPNGASRSATLVSNVFQEKRGCERAIAKGKVEKLTVCAKVKDYVYLSEKKDKVTIDFDALQDAVDLKGYYTLAHTLEMTPAEAYRVYHLRDTSETGFATESTQLGFKALRVHCDPSIYSKHLVSFVASVIRNFIMRTCLEMEVPTSVMICELSRIHIRLLKNKYVAIHSESVITKNFLARYDVTPITLELLADDYSTRDTRDDRSLERTLPKAEGEKGNDAKADSEGTRETTPEASRQSSSQGEGKIGNMQEPEDKETEKNKVGRPAGRKDSTPRTRRTNAELGKPTKYPSRRNKGEAGKSDGATVKGAASETPLTSAAAYSAEATAVQNADPAAVPAPKRKGRPSGAKNKVTLAREAEEAELKKKWEALLRNQAEKEKDSKKDDVNDQPRE